MKLLTCHVRIEVMNLVLTLLLRHFVACHINNVLPHDARKCIYHRGVSDDDIATSRKITDLFGENLRNENREVSFLFLSGLLEVSLSKSRENPSSVLTPMDLCPLLLQSGV